MTRVRTEQKKSYTTWECKSCGQKSFYKTLKCQMCGSDVSNHEEKVDNNIHDRRAIGEIGDE